LDRYAVAPGSQVVLSEVDTADTGDWSKGDAAERLEELRGRLQDLQERLYAEARRSLLVVLQSTDTGGKDGAIKKVFGCINPAGCQVVSFKRPTDIELAHDFLWRVHQRTPARGMITIFNRSHYEDVVAVRVRELVDPPVWEPRFARINEFERLLAEAGTTVVKLFLHISRDEQRRRLQKRLDNPDKHWKFNAGDLDDRARWDDFWTAYSDAITRCSTADAPWHVIPADAKWYRDLVVAEIVVRALETMDPRFPSPNFDPAAVSIPE
jgi:PPK2 family polyphosphate:nucleotide phosphotransferase